jgi:hypothetical protein
MNKLILVLVLAPFFITVNSQTRKKKINQEKAISKTGKSLKVLTGFNQNFSMMPNMNEAMYKNIKLLKPKMLRYPGGTVTHSWNWKDGVIQKRSSTKVHPIAEIKTLVDYTNADFVFVLDIVNRTLEDQIEMLTEIEKLGVKIKFIELGNELYAKEANYTKVFPTGKDYATKVNLWIPKLKQKFPKAKIAALLLGRKVKESNVRMYNWNTEVVENTMKNIDAYTYHIYINEDYTFAKEKDEFTEVVQKANTKNKELWITEYGNKQERSKSTYYTDLTALADFVEHFPSVTIALNHQIVGGTKSKLTEDGKDFIQEGKMFLTRVSK